MLNAELRNRSLLRLASSPCQYLPGGVHGRSHIARWKPCHRVARHVMGDSPLDSLWREAVTRKPISTFSPRPPEFLPFVF